MGRRGVGYAVTFRSLPAALAPAHPILLCSALPVWLCAARRIPTCAGWLSVASNLHRKGGDNRQVAPLPDRWLPCIDRVLKPRSKHSSSIGHVDLDY